MDQVVSAREVHAYLETTERFNAWFEKRCEMFGQVKPYANNFAYAPNRVSIGSGAEREIDDYLIPIDVAKMFLASGTTKKSAEIIKYLVGVEKAWNDPIKVVERGMQWLKYENSKLTRQIERKDRQLDKAQPAIEFTNAVHNSYDCITVGEFAKLIKTGQNRLFEFLKQKDYLMRNNQPYQKYLDMGVFRTIEKTMRTPFGDKLYIQTLITPSGQTYLWSRTKALRKKTEIALFKEV
jgi:anti-repressor protein